MKTGRELIQDVLQYIGKEGLHPSNPRYDDREVLMGLLEEFLSHRHTPNEIIKEIEGMDEVSLHRLGGMINAIKLERISSEMDAVKGGVDEFISNIKEFEEDEEKRLRVKTLLKLEREKENGTNN